MKRKSIVTICIISIIVISLMLLGLTYGFYLTQIDGNKNSKSIEVVTGESKVLFTDLSESATSEIIMPGYTMLKVFTVENIGNTTGKYSVFLVDVFNNFNRKEDITYVLYRSNGEVTDVNLDTNFSSWTNLTPEPVVFPSTSSVIKADETIAVDDTYTYALVITYKNADVNQNEDQGKTFSASVNLRAESTETNPYSEGTLAYSIINRAKSITESDSKTNGYAMYSETLRTTPAEEISEADESLLLIADDDYTATTNKPSYYFRGNVKDNYVNFAGMCWRIVRIEGDGSIKLTLESQSSCFENMTRNISIGTSDFGYKKLNYINIADYKNSTNRTTAIKYKLENWFNKTEEVDGVQVRKNITTDAESLLKTEEWCLGNNEKSFDHTTFEELTTTASENYISGTRFFYETGRNLYGKGVTQNATLICNGEKYPSKIGILTADEVVFAGGEGGISNNNYYLQNNSYSWWLLSHADFLAINDYIFYVGNDGYVGSYNVEYDAHGVRPAVTLKSSVKITSGNGTLDNPYVIE